MINSIIQAIEKQDLILILCYQLREGFLRIMFKNKLKLNLN